MKQEVPQTNVHIIGLGRIGLPLYIALLNAIKTYPEIGNVYGYKSGKTIAEKDFLRFLSAANTYIPVADADFLKKNQRTTIQEYEDLSHFTETLSARVDTGRSNGRKNLLICLKNYDLNGINNSQKEYLEVLQEYETLYKQESKEMYLAMLRRRGFGTDTTWLADREKELEKIIHGNGARRGSVAAGFIGVREFARALTPVDSTIDLVFMVSNPVDITTYVYAAETGRVPETLCCPQDNDRMRYISVIEKKLREQRYKDSHVLELLSRQNIMSIGAHNQWNMLISNPLQNLLRSLFLDEHTYQMFLEEAALEVNQLAEDQISMTGTTPNDYDKVLFTAVIDALENKEKGDRIHTKIIQYSPDDNLYVGWSGTINNMEVRGAEYGKVFPPDVDEETLVQWKDGKKPIRNFLNKLIHAGLLKEIDTEKSRTRKEILATAQLVPIEYTTEIDDHAMKRQRLGNGEYFITTYYQGNNPYLAFMKQDGLVFHVISLVPIEAGRIPRALTYDSETKELYSAHRSGIDMLKVTQLDNPWREVLRLSELPELTKGQKSKRDDLVGVTSLLLNEKELFFTVPGYGIGAIGRERRSPFFSWDAVARYSTNAHIDALQLLRSSSDGLYVALSGNTLIIGDGREWKAYPVTDGTLEALVGTKDALFGFATMDHAIEVVEWSRYGSPTSFAQSAGGIKQKQRLAYKPTESRLERGTTPLETAVGYRKRLKAAANSEGVIAVLYDGTPFFAHGDHGDFSPLPKIPLVTYVSSREGIGVDALHTIASGFVISGFSTKCLRFAGDDLVHDTISGFGYYNGQQSNPARYMATITI